MKEKQQHKHTHLGSIVMVILVVVIIGMAAGYYLLVMKTDVLKGTWSIDDITSFRFDGKGEGAMLLPSSEYIFRYEIDDNMLSIDFDDESVSDVVYEFQIENDSLLLTASEDSRVVKNLTLNKVE